MTGTELDDILADTPQVEVETPTAEANRDEHGRFAPKAEPEVVVEKPVVEAEQHEGNIPPAALAASRQKAREKDQENEQLRQQMAEMRGQIQLLSQRPAHQQAPKPEEAKSPDFWDDPNAFVNNALTPVQQQLQQQREVFSKMMATQAHGKETVDGAFKAFVEAAQANPGAYAGEYQSIMKSEHPYDALVTWHKRQQTLSTVGNDPNAWLEAEIEKRISDPEYQGKLLERIRGTAAGNTNRSNPVTNLPPSLNRIAAGGNAPGEADMSDQGLFAHALR